MLLIIAAVPLETFLLRQQLQTPLIGASGDYQVFSGTLCNQQVLIAHSGVGQSAMALQLTRLLMEHSPQAVLLCGCGGSYPASDLKIGDLALANEEIYGDLGVLTENNFIPLDQLEIPQNSKMMPPLRQRYPLSEKLVNLAQRLLPEATVGPFVSINCCSGFPALSTALEQRTGGICENMEGAAAAQVCDQFDLPLLELRGISNPTGSRDPQQWDIELGAEVAQQGILTLLENWSEEKD